jgi:hypothetical protein|tara:strand:+ start:419 stop:538 length:120 start_codon:yes stop_codon:yes gene_type:complete
LNAAPAIPSVVFNNGVPGDKPSHLLETESGDAYKIVEEI